ncbi:MAG: type II secretion system F family protein [Burkholderiales bacterium]|nr:type II secretion system F family protein [Burkholderiales bacterium]
MLNFPAGNVFLAMMVMVFVAVMLLFESLYVMWRSHRGPEAKKLNSRLQALAATHDRSTQTQLLKQRMLSELPVWERYLQSLPRVRGLDRIILQSGMNWTVAKLLLGSVVLGAMTWIAIISVAHQSILFGAAAGAVVGALPFMYLSYQRNLRVSKMERQLPDALDLMTRALQAGHAFTSALKMAGEEMPEPMAGEFRTVHDEVNFGVSLEQALAHLSERVPLTDLRYFVVAVLIQRDSGGNLTEILANLSKLIRERLKLLARVRVLSAEGRMSAWILGLLPFFLGGVMTLANPGFMTPLWTDPIGIAMLKVLLVMMVVGAVILRRIIRIRV